MDNPEVKDGSDEGEMETDEVKQLFSKLSDICKLLEQKGEKVLVLTTAAKKGLDNQLGKSFIPGTTDMLAKVQRFCEDQRGNCHLPSEPGETCLTDNVASKASETANQGEADLDDYIEQENMDEGSKNADDTFTTGDVRQCTSHKAVEKLIESNDRNEVSKADSETLDSTENCVSQRRTRRSKRNLVEKSVTGMNVDENPDPKRKQSKMKETDFLCSHCNKTFLSLSNLKLHLKKIHKISDTCIQAVLDNSLDKGNEKDDKIESVKSSEQPGEIQKSVIDKQNDKQENFKDSKSGVQSQIKCEKCGAVFNLKQHLETHLRLIPNCMSNVKPGQSDHDVNVDTLNIIYKDAGNNEIRTPLKEILTAQNKEPYTCLVCNTTFTRKSNFKRHVISHADYTQPDCTICGAKFKNRENRLRHMKDHNERPFQCEKCDKHRFETEKALNDHMEKCTKFTAEELTCDTCGHVSKCRAALRIHKNVHLGVKPYPCQHCGKNMTTSSSLERHIMSMHQNETPFECSICHKAFKVKDNYKKHLKHHEEPKYWCDICGKRCVELGNLKKHMMSHTKEKPFVCEVCGNRYARKALLDNHRRLHTGEKPYKCKVEGCEKAFRSYANLRQHTRYHSKDEPYVCDMCGKTFKQPGRLSHHRKSHAVEYQWPCAYCPEKFKTIFIYKGHLAREHPDMKNDIENKTNIKLHQCHLCDKVYGDKEDLTRHIYIHEGRKPFRCDHCFKAFNDKSNLKQHMKIHSNDRKFICKICSKSFLLKKILRAHLRNSHGQVDYEGSLHGKTIQRSITKTEFDPFRNSSNSVMFQDEQMTHSNETHVIVQKEPSSADILGSPSHYQIITNRKDLSDTDNVSLGEVTSVLPHLELLQQSSSHYKIYTNIPAVLDVYK